MPKAARLGDLAGGPILEGSSNVFINGIAAARQGDAITPHDSSPTHIATIASGSSTVKINGKQAARLGDPATCGHTISEGSDDVNIG